MVILSERCSLAEFVASFLKPLLVWLLNSRLPAHPKAAANRWSQAENERQLELSSLPRRWRRALLETEKAPYAFAALERGGAEEGSE